MNHRAISDIEAFAGRSKVLATAYRLRALILLADHEPLSDHGRR